MLYFYVSIVVLLCEGNFNVSVILCESEFI